MFTILFILSVCLLQQSAAGHSASINDIEPYERRRAEPMDLILDLNEEEADSDQPGTSFETDDYYPDPEFIAKRFRIGSRTSKGGKEHTKNARKSTEEKHQKGQSRKGSDKRGGEKGDARRPYGK